MAEFCVKRTGECFISCRNNSTWLSFGIGNIKECPGELRCLLYSQIYVEKTDHINDHRYSYYLMGPQTCCRKPCLDNKICTNKCQCGCPEGFFSKNCTCSEKNASRIFNRFSLVTLPGAQVKQIESGDQTWAVSENKTALILLNETKWRALNDTLNYISVGKAGVWALNVDNDILIRKGINTQNPLGTNWEAVSFGDKSSVQDKLVQIESGNLGVVYGVNGMNKIYCRTGYTNWSPFGSSWAVVPGKAKHVSCGDYGCWAVRPDNTVGFREGVTMNNCPGTGWVNITHTDIVQLDSGATGSTYGISTNYTLYRISGICSKLPWGQKRWRDLIDFPDKFKHVTIGNTYMYAVRDNGTVVKFRHF